MVPVRFTPVPVLVFTAPLKVVVPTPAACTRLAAVMPLVSVTLFALVMLIAPSRPFGNPAPTAPVNRMLPALPAFSVSVSALGAAVLASSVLWKVMLPPVPPPTLVSMLTRPLAPPVSVTARLKSTASLVVLIVRGAVMLTAPAPFCVTAPSATMSPFSVNSPALLKVTIPPPVVVMPAFTV